MDITSAFLTQQIPTGGKASPQAVPGNAGSLAIVPGANFIDMILARLTAQNGETVTGQAEGDLPVTEQTALALPETIDLNPGAPVTGETPVDLLELTLPETPPAGTVTPSMLAARKKLENFLQSLIQGVPQDGQPVIAAIPPGLLKQALGETGGESGSPALIATGLTPEDLTQLLQDIIDGDEQGEAFIIGTIRILPPEAKKEAIFLPRGLIITTPQNQAGETGTSQPETIQDPETLEAAQLNSLTIGGEETGEGESTFDDILRILEKAQSAGQDNGKIISGLEKAINTIRQISAGNSAVQGAPPAPASVSTDFVLTDIYPEGTSAASLSGQGQSLTTTVQMTSLSAQAHQAVYPHPATQTVAATIAKAAGTGETKSITIRLEPPELGKVHIRMEFGKDHSVKAHLAVEKPETYMMLQRDAHVLERALLDAGLDTNGNSLSFSMAQDGNPFAQDGNGGGSGNSGGGATASGETDTVILETRMDWIVDPDTGLAHYNALV